MAGIASQADTILSKVELYISNCIDLIFHFGVPGNCNLQIPDSGHLEPGLIARTVKATKSQIQTDHIAIAGGF